MFKTCISKLNPAFCRTFFLWCTLVVFAACSLATAGSETKDPFRELQKRLARDGFDKELIERVYQDPRVGLNLSDVSLFFIHSEARLNYDQFTTPDSIKKARAYLEKNRKSLHRAETKYGVDKEVIVAILLVETRLGTFLGTSPILNTLSTMAAISDPELSERLWKQISDPRRLPRDEFEKKVTRKSAWAYKELMAFLTYTQRENIDPSSIIGSYAGALGVSQFMPTSIMAYARDGGGDNRIDLFDHEDAIASIGNYLKSFGWKPGIGIEKAKKIIWHYNRSSYYVNTILKIADHLRK